MFIIQYDNFNVNSQFQIFWAKNKYKNRQTSSLPIYKFKAKSNLPKCYINNFYFLPQQSLYFFPLPQGQGSFLPTFF